MMMKQDSTTSTASTACGHCGVEERWLIHHVRHRGIFRRLCTSCILRLHPQSFCPTCFVVYDRSPPPSNDAVTCFKCYSASHSHCVGSNAPSPYVCPPCVNPNVPIFGLKKAENESFRAVDKKMARVLLAAARIAAISMSKAAVASRAEAEKRAKELTFTKKRAREALEHVACIVAKEKLKRKELLSTEVLGSGNVGVLEKNHSKGGNASSIVTVVGTTGSQPGVDIVDSSSEVLAALNAVELKEKERMEGFKAQNAVSVPPSNVVPMDVEDNDRLGMGSVSDIGVPFVQNHGTVKDNERSGDLCNLDGHNAQGEKVSNGLLSVPSVGDQPQYMQSTQAREENIASQQ